MVDGAEQHLGVGAKEEDGEDGVVGGDGDALGDGWEDLGVRGYHEPREDQGTHQVCPHI